MFAEHALYDHRPELPVLLLPTSVPYTRIYDYDYDNDD